jgi:ubiquinone/menaquinone biosynthesis C-methylase UbiE/rhodanese-related sulfurtransferase
MRFISLPSIRTLTLVCVVAHPWALDFVTGPLAGTPFDETLQGCGQGNEQKREQNQRLPDVLKALDAKPGAIVADIGAGSGFYTVRLAQAVGDAGRVYAVDISESSLRDLRSRVERDGLKNVEVIKGDVDDPNLPEASLDAALIVNAYHEMTEHQAMLTAIRKALKPSGRLVILEPISPSRRTASRSDQTRQHEIASELVMQDARSAGYKIATLEEPFSNHSGHGVEWLMVLTPASSAALNPPDHVHTPADSRDQALAQGRPSVAEEFADTKSPDLRIHAAEFRRLYDAGKVVVLDVRDPSLFNRGHIKGARLAPLSALRDEVAALKRSDALVVTYCSCPAEETSARAVLYLKKQGVTNVKALVGGYEAWESSGGAVER